jgi:hypothetical protein
MSSVSPSNNQTEQPWFNFLGFWSITLIRWADGFKRFATRHVNLQGFKVQGPLKTLDAEGDTFLPDIRNDPPTQHRTPGDRNARFTTASH